MSGPFLVAVDGSDASERAVNFAAGLAKAGGVPIVLAHVIEWSPYSFHTPEELAERHKRREEEIDRAQSSVLDPVAESVRAQDIGVETVVRHGHIAETLVSIAEEYGASQTFIGRKGESRMKTLLFGSVAAALVQISATPVTVVP